MSQAVYQSRGRVKSRFFAVVTSARPTVCPSIRSRRHDAEVADDERSRTRDCGRTNCGGWRLLYAPWMPMTHGLDRD
jgi:hypothetical protein